MRRSAGSPLPLRIGVDAAESMSMKSDGPRVPGERRAERPVAVRPVVHSDARERIPLAEENPIAHVSLRVDDVERGGARQLGCRRARRTARSRQRQTDGAVPRGAKRDRGSDRQRGGRHDDAGRAQPVQQRNEDEAAGGGADEIGRVEDVDPIASAARTQPT